MHVRSNLRQALVVLGAALALLTTACERPSEAEVARWGQFVGRIDGVSTERLGLSWRPGCPVSPSDLRLLTLSYWGVDGVGHQGELIVHRDIAPGVINAFRVLWITKFPINRMETPERYIRAEDIGPDGEYLPGEPGPDTANDTSGFLCRRSTGARSWSQHAYGKAIDINPVQNPYVKGSTVVPLNGAYNPSAPGTITRTGIVVRAFQASGLKWGGNWRSAKDYMHFSANGR